MKKTLASISLICYLVISCGVVINFHYCMDRLASTRLFVSQSKVCAKCGMQTKKHGCCRDEVKIIKMHDDQQKVDAFYSLLVPGTTNSTITSEYLVLPYQNVDESRHYHNHSPPLLTGQDTYLQNCVFRI